MDEELQQLEAELKGLRPPAPSSRLLAALEAELAAPAAKRRAILPFDWTVVLPLAAAAAIIFLSVVRPDVSKPTHASVANQTAATMLKPVAVEKVLIAAEDEGLVTLADGTPARRARLQYVDTFTWRNPATNASLRWTMPREEVRVVPVHFQ